MRIELLRLLIEEQGIRGLENLMGGKTLVWLHRRRAGICPVLNGTSWPEDYELAAVVDTGNLEEAFELTNAWDTWEEEYSPMIPIFPYGLIDDPECNGEYVLPRSTSIGDVLVKPDGTVHLVRPRDFLRIA